MCEVLLNARLETVSRTVRRRIGRNNVSTQSENVSTPRNVRYRFVLRPLPEIETVGLIQDIEHSNEEILSNNSQIENDMRVPDCEHENTLNNESPILSPSQNANTSILQLSADNLMRLEIANRQPDDVTNATQGEFGAKQFTRLEFMNCFRKNNRLLFVHDIEHFYRFRYPRGTDSVYACRRKTCKAKLIIDADGKCTQLGTEPHGHPSAKEHYFDIVLMQAMKAECMERDVLRVDRMRSVYDRYITK